MSLPEQTDLQMFIASMKPRIDVYHISPLCKSRKILYVSPVHQYQAQTWNVFKRYFRVCKSKTTFTWMYFKKKKKRKKKKKKMPPEWDVSGERRSGLPNLQ